jgi:hypothetical protein
MSASNCAEIYNMSLARPENQPSEWPFSFNLCQEHIWSGISHLEHIEQEQEMLTVPHGSDQRDRLAEHIKMRNKLFMEKGQPEWAHYCENCVRFYLDKDGNPSGELSL